MPLLTVPNLGAVAIASSTGTLVAPPLVATGSVASTSIVLDGSQSYDPDGGALTYHWVYLSSTTAVRTSLLLLKTHWSQELKNIRPL